MYHFSRLKGQRAGRSFMLITMGTILWEGRGGIKKWARNVGLGGAAGALMGLGAPGGTLARGFWEVLF